MSEARKLFKEGQLLASAGEPAEAVEKFVQAAGLSDEPGIRAHTAMAYLSLGNMDEAATSIVEARRKEPLNPAFQLNEALINLAQGSLDESTELARDVILRFPTNTFAYNILALASWERGDIDGALKSLNNYGICDNLEVRVRLMMLLQASMPDEIPSDPSGPDVRPPAPGGLFIRLRGKLTLDKAVRQLFKGSTTDALTNVLKARSMRSDLPGLDYYHGFALVTLERFTEALAILEQVPADDFFAKQSEFFRSICHLKLGRLDEAEVALKSMSERALSESQLTDFQEFIPCLRGEIALRQGDYEKARTHYTRALTLWGPLLEELLSEAIKLKADGKFPKKSDLALSLSHASDYTSPSKSDPPGEIEVSPDAENQDQRPESKSDRDEEVERQESVEELPETDESGESPAEEIADSEKIDSEEEAGGANDVAESDDDSESIAADLIAAHSEAEEDDADVDVDLLNIGPEHIEQDELGLPSEPEDSVGGTTVLRRAIAEADETIWTVPVPIKGVVCMEVDDGPTQRFFLLRHPDDGSYMKLDGRERFIWRQMDGATSLTEVVEAYYRKYNALGFKNVEQVYHRLEEAGFLQIDSGTKALPTAEASASDEVEDWLTQARTRLAFRPVGAAGADSFFQSFVNIGGTILSAEALLSTFSILGIASLVTFIASMSTGLHGETYHIFQPGGGFYTTALVGIYLWNFFGSLIHAMGRGVAVKSNFCEVPEVAAVLKFGLLGVHVDVSDSRRLNRKTRVFVHFTGIGLEVFVAGLLGAMAMINNYTRGSETLRDILALGACVIGTRVFFHLCPLIRSEGYQAATESLNSPHLRKAALRFLRPRYWVQLWMKERWQQSEVAFLLFGLWCAVWLTVAAKLATFILTNQFTSTVVGLFSNLMSQNAHISVDELFAVLMILVVLVPALLFLVLSVFYIGNSVYRMFRQMDTWTSPANFVLGVALLSLFIGFLGYAFQLAGSSFPQLYWGLASILSIPLFLLVYSQANTETEGNVLGGLALSHVLGSAAVIVAMTGALFHYTVMSAQPMLMTIGVIVVAVALLLVLKNLVFSIGTVFAGLWFGMAVGLGLVLAMGAPASLATLRGVNIPPASPVALSLIIAGGLFFQACAWGFWFVAAHFNPEFPEFTVEEAETDEELLLVAFNYSTCALLENISAIAGDGFVDSLTKDLQTKIGDIEANFKPEDFQVVHVTSYKDRSFDELESPLRDVVGHIVSSGFRVAGSTGMSNILRGVHKHLHWEERHMLASHLIQDPRWASVLGGEKHFSKDDRLGLLKETFLFHNFDDDELEKIGRIVNSHTYKRGEVIIKQDDPGGEAFIIQDGRVEVVVEDEKGDFMVVASLSSGDFFGELALLEDAPRSATVRAVADTHVLILEKPIFERFVQHQGGAKDKLAEAIRALRVIQRMPLFEEFTAGQMATVASKFDMEKYLDTERVINQGEVGDKFYIIQDGNAEVYLDTDGEEEKIRTLRAGEFFGEIALLQDVPRTASIQAAGPLIAFSLSKKSFLDALGGHPFARLKLQQESARRIAAAEHHESAIA